MNSNWITNLEINNFKSIKHLKMDCKRINVLIGRPNVGKSNILEALSLYEASNSHNNRKLLSDYIRYEEANQLFYFLDRKKYIEVITNLGFALVSHDGITYRIVTCSDTELMDKIKNDLHNRIAGDSYGFFNTNENKNIQRGVPSYLAYFDDKQQNNVRHISGYPQLNPIRNYHFQRLTEHKDPFALFLKHPFGENLFTIIENNRELWYEFAGFFNEYGFDLVLDTLEEKLKIQRREGRYVTSIPYSLTSDTLQRFIFHLAAIASNENSVVVFEEPESHSYPPYVTKLAERIISNKSNQFFIATHSPYLLAPFIEQCPREEVNIFITSYENYETKIRVLNNEELDNIMDAGIDLFFNLRAFQK